MEMKRLFQHLDAQINQDDYKNSLIILCQSSIRLYKSLTQKNQNLYEADLELIETIGYCPEPLRTEILRLKKHNTQFVLFNQKAFYLIYYLLIHDIDFQLNDNAVSDQTHLTKVEPYSSFSLVGVFLIANEILSRVETISDTSSEESASICDFYSRCLVDPAGAIGRSGLFYNNTYFDEQIKNRYDLSVDELRHMNFALFAHVLSKDPAIIDPFSSFKVLQEKQATIRKVLDLLSTSNKNKPISFSRLISDLPINLNLREHIRGKPFIEAGGLYFCVCPELLGGVLADLPHHLIFTDMRLKEEKTKPLHDQRGLAFQTYLKTLSKDVLRDICREEIRKKHGEFGDLVINLGPEEILMIEIKSADPQESVKKGNVAETVKRFLLPPERKNSGKKTPGPLQVMERAMDYREKFGFRGKIHTAVISYGWFPEVPIFDQLFTQCIKTHEICLKYESDKANFPMILLNSFTWELMLSGIEQLKSQSVLPQSALSSMLESLKPSAISPSQSSDIIENYIASHELKFSVAPLFKSHIQDLAEECASQMQSFSET